MADPVISVRGLRKSYGDVEAVRGIDLEVRPGEVFAFLGPNGAGKTTTVEILEGYRERDARRGRRCSARTRGSAGRAWRERIGIVLQSCRLDPYLTVRESLALFAGYYAAATGRGGDRAGRPRGQGRRARRASSPAASSAASTSAWRWSAIPSCSSSTSRRPASTRRRGARPGRRSPACATSARRSSSPPTTWTRRSASPTGSRSSPAGEVVARGTPEDLGDRERQPATDHLPARRRGGLASRPTTPVQTLNELTGRALERGVELEGLEVRRPSLEDVYLELTEPTRPSGR